MNNKGFTIIEVVVAIVILSMGILGLAGTAASVTRMVGRSQQYSKAATMAAERFEILRSQGCTNMSSGTGTSGTYSIAWTVTSITNAKQVTITVTSPTARGSRTNTFTQVVTCQV